MTVVVAPDRATAAAAVLGLIPKGAEVLTATSETLEALELTTLLCPIFGIHTRQLGQAGELPTQFTMRSALAKRRAFYHGIIKSS